MALQRNIFSAYLQHPACLQRILLIEQQAGCVLQAFGINPIGKIALHIRRTGCCTVTHRTQSKGIAAGCRLCGAGDCRHHFAVFQPASGVILIIHGNLHQYRCFRREGCHRISKPAGQTVSIDRDTERRPLRVIRKQTRQCLPAFLLQQAHTICMQTQLSPGGSGFAWLPANHQCAAGTFLQQFDPL